MDRLGLSKRGSFKAEAKRSNLNYNEDALRKSSSYIAKLTQKDEIVKDLSLQKLKN